MKAKDKIKSEKEVVKILTKKPQKKIVPIKKVEDKIVDEPIILPKGYYIKSVTQQTVCYEMLEEDPLVEKFYPGQACFEIFSSCNKLNKAFFDTQDMLSKMYQVQQEGQGKLDLYLNQRKEAMTQLEAAIIAKKSIEESIEMLTKYLES